MSPNFKTLCWWQFWSTIENNLDNFCERNKGWYIRQITIRQVYQCKLMASKAKTIRCIELWVIFKANILFERCIWICLTFEGNSDFNFTKYVRDCFIRNRQAYYYWKTLLVFFFHPPPPLFHGLKANSLANLFFLKHSSISALETDSPSKEIRVLFTNANFRN